MNNKRSITAAPDGDSKVNELKRKLDLMHSFQAEVSKPTLILNGTWTSTIAGEWFRTSFAEKCKHGRGICDGAVRADVSERCAKIAAKMHADFSGFRRLKCWKLR